MLLAEAQPDPIASVSSTQSSPIASAKSPPRKSKTSPSQNGPSPSNPSPTALDVASPSPFPALRPFRRYSRRALVALSKSPLVAPPPGMPALKDWFGCVVFISVALAASHLSASEWEPHVSPRKENDHHTSSTANTSARNRFVRPILPLNICGLHSIVDPADEKRLMMASLFNAFSTALF